MSSDLRTTPRTDTGVTTTTDNSARTMTIIGFVCAIVAILFLPILFGPAAIVLGIVAYRKGDRLGMWAAIAGAVCMIAGFAIGVALFASNN